MRILIATPLYPPDTASHAVYVKELATRLKTNCQTTILAYNHLPEQIEGVHIISIEKNHVAFVRIMKYTFALLKAMRSADLVYIQNGPSVELPMLLVAPFTSIPFVLRLGDAVALQSTEKNFVYKTLRHLAQKFSRIVVTHPLIHVKTESLSSKKILEMQQPHIRPEILPFAEYPKEAFERYNTSWNDHVQKLLTLFSL